MTIPKPLTETHPRLTAWLKKTNDDIWERHEQRTCGGYTLPWSSEKRLLEDWEWKRILSLMNSGKVIVTVSAAQGFVLFLSLWSYPSSPKNEPELLIYVSNDHLKNMRSGLNSDQGGFWQLITPLTHSEANMRAVECSCLT